MAGALTLAAALAGDACAARTTASDPEAVRLLRAAADAALRVSYEGVRHLTTWNRAGHVTSQVNVAHTPGDGTSFTSTPDGGARPSERSFQPDSAAVWGTGLAAPTIALLTRNYRLVRAADGAVCGRRARVIEARRADGSAAGRFWVDVDTGLLLHRELIDANGRQVAVTGFTELQIPRPRVEEPVALWSEGGTAGTTARPWEDRLEPVELADLRDRGWPIPESLLGRLRLSDARRSATQPGIVHLSYSDGLASVSVFVQRGALDARRLGGWKRTGSGGRTIYRREALHRWAVSAGDGFVHTVLTEAPQSTADSVARALPPDRSAIRSRLARGFGRLGAWVNPFG